MKFKHKQTQIVYDNEKDYAEFNMFSWNEFLLEHVDGNITKIFSDAIECYDICINEQYVDLAEAFKIGLLEIDEETQLKFWIKPNTG